MVQGRARPMIGVCLWLEPRMKTETQKTAGLTQLAALIGPMSVAMLTTADVWDPSNGTMLRLFAMAAPVVAAKPAGRGERDTLTRLTRASQRPPSTVAG